MDDRLPSDVLGQGADDDALWAIFSTSRHPMLLADDQRRYINANAAALGLLGYDLPTLRTMRIDDITIPEYRPFLDDIWNDFLARGGTIGQFAVLKADGSTVHIEFNATADMADGLHLSIFINPDSAGEAQGLAEDEGGKNFDEPVESVVAQTGSILTPLEKRVITLLALGLNWHEVADELETSPAEVRAAMQEAMEKLGARTRAHAVSVAIRAGEIDLSDPSLL